MLIGDREEPLLRRDRPDPRAESEPEYEGEGESQDDASLFPLLPPAPALRRRLDALELRSALWLLKGARLLSLLPLRPFLPRAGGRP